MKEFIIAILKSRYTVSIMTILTILLGRSLGLPPAQAQGGEKVEVLAGRTEPGAGIVYLLPNLERGQKLYVYAEGVSGNLDPLIALADETLDAAILRENYAAAVQQAIAAGRDPLEVIPEVAGAFFLAWDDDGGQGYDAALEFTVPADGTYKLVVLTTPYRPTFGQYRLLLGLNAPTVLTGDAEVTGDTLAVLDEQSSPVNLAVQTVSGTLTATKTDTFYELNDLKAGDTLYVFIDATSGDLAPIISLNDFGDKPLATGNFSGDQTSASLQYTFNEDGANYRLRILACCDDGPRTTGDYRLLVGINAPEVLTGQAESTTRPVLQLAKVVKVGVKLQQITGVDQKAENYGAVATLQMTWQDPALAFSPDSCDCRFKLFQGDSFNQFAVANNLTWPEFTLFNQQGNRWTQNSLVVVLPDGQATYLERFSTTFQAPDFNFRRFPFDRQDFYIRVDSLIPEEFFTFADLEDFTEVGDQLGEEEWYVTSSDTMVSSENVSTSAASSRFSFHFEARRHLSFYLFRIFVPVLIIIVVSWTTFFLKDYGKRVDVASANLLLFIAFNFTIADDLPRLGYLTLMDTILVSTFIVTSLVVIFNVYLKRLEVVGKENFANKIDQYMIWVYPLAYFVSFVIVGFLFTGGGEPGLFDLNQGG